VFRKLQEARAKILGHCIRGHRTLSVALDALGLKLPHDEFERLDLPREIESSHLSGD
jgi:hypothetical protein